MMAINIFIFTTHCSDVVLRWCCARAECVPEWKYIQQGEYLVKFMVNWYVFWLESSTTFSNHFFSEEVHFFFNTNSLYAHKYFRSGTECERGAFLRPIRLWIFDRFSSVAPPTLRYPRRQMILMWLCCCSQPGLRSEPVCCVGQFSENTNLC